MNPKKQKEKREEITVVARGEADAEVDEGRPRAGAEVDEEQAAVVGLGCGA